jgi:hypothetical protein
MFSRLLKHEWKANSGLLGLLSLAAVGIGVLATAVLRILVNTAGSLWWELENGLGAVLVVALGMFLLFAVVALSVYAIAVQVILLHRFYKNKYTDEGYLTFTLPVKPTQIFWSSFLNMLIWLIISVLVVFGVVFLAVLFGTAEDGLVNTDVFDAMKDLLEFFRVIDWQMLLQEQYSIPYLIVLGLTFLVTPFYALILPMACITAGAVLAKKHKILASFGVYYGVNFMVGIITSVVSVVPTLLIMNRGDTEALYLVSMAIQLVISLALTIGAYCFTIHTMKKKLNLP